MTGPTISQQFLTPSELATLGGAVSAVLLITNALRYALGWNAKVIGLILSLLAACYGTWVSNDHSSQAWVLAVPNAALIYSSAIGLASMTTKIPLKGNSPQIIGGGGPEEVQVGKRFWARWF